MSPSKKSSLVSRKQVKSNDALNKIVKKRELKGEIDEKPSKRVKTELKQPLKSSNYTPVWNEHELLAEQHSLDFKTAKNIIELFNDSNTIPFIARYRKNETNNMTPEDLRAVKDSYEEILSLKNKISTVLKALEKGDFITEQLRKSVTTATSIEELEYIYSPYKPGNKRTLAERAKELGLEEPALEILNKNKHINLKNFVSTKEELSTVSLVEKGIIHIIASVIATNTDILAALKDLRKRTNFTIKTKKNSSKKETAEKANNEFKFDNYFDFEVAVKYIKPHQVLAINRGEHLKILSVKVNIPDSFFENFKKLCYIKYLKNNKDSQREHLIKLAIDDSYTRLVEPLVKREIRAELKQKAERASCEVFSANLKQLLLTSPFKGKPILGIDPGFANGCKLAVISEMGDFLDCGVIYPHTNKKSSQDVTVLKKLIKTYNCDLIALGNGTACRQTEQFLTNLIQEKVFYPLDVKYTIVREEGASIYSCSLEAKKEFPDLDPNIISAVSLARRVQEPLAELIKVDPKHLGIGMYQHDVKKKQLDDALNDVISECVSFVGVDLNTASQCLLKHVAGLSQKRAQQIIDFRTKNGAFGSRKQLLKVTGIGQKVYQQCAGFLRISITNQESPEFTKLDCTNIHPESYDIVKKLFKKFNLKVGDIGEFEFITKIKNTKFQVKQLSEELGSDEETIKLIIEALSKPLNYDFRNDNSTGPIFKKGLMSLGDISAGCILTGVVNNVTHFGCFVDIGVGSNGLIHVTKSNGLNLQIGSRVEVKVLDVDMFKKRIGLQALKLL